ncbi:MAG: ABC transporter permease [Vicinamibacterales bacterium]
MTPLRVLVRRLLGRLGRRRWESELDEELRFHLQMEIDRHRARGLDLEDARQAALRGFGGVDVTKDAYRDQRGLPFVDTLIQDLRYALRLLVRHRAFSLVAVVTLALGIGANTAIFSVVHGVLLEPLPFDGASRIVTVWQDFSAQGGPEQEWIEIPNFVEWRGESDLFETMVAYGSRAANLTGRGDPQRLAALAVSDGFFRTFAVSPAVGRDFTAADDRPGAAPVAILAWGLWQREFAGDASVVGQSIQLDGTPVTVVGVAPAGFDLPGAPGLDLFLPSRLDPSRSGRGNFAWLGLARLKPGVTVERAEARLDAMMQEIGARFPEDRGVTVSLVPMLDQLVAPVRTGLWVLLAVVGLVLLIACANIANLMLSRGASRGREMAVRAAMGAGRRRLVRQLLTESLVLALAGGGLGVLIAWWGTAALTARIPPAAAPRIENVTLDGTVLLFTLGIAVVAGLLFGLAPVVQSARHDAGLALKAGGRDAQEAGAGGGLRAVLAAGQIALALCLLIAAGLATRSFVALVDVDPGFRPDGLTTAFVSMPPDGFQGPPELVDFMDRLIARVAARPGFDSVAAVSVLPLSGNDSDTSFRIEGRPDLDVPGREPVAWFRRVTSGYFRTMGLPVIEGREFTDADRAGAPKVALVSEVTADRFWPGEDVVGKRIRFGDDEWTTIVGVTRGVRHAGLSQPPRPELYLPFAQRPGRQMTLVVRSSADEAAVTSLLRSDLHEIAPALPLSNVTTMKALMAQSVAQPRFLMSLTAVFGALALVLASVGIYGVMAYAVSRRTTEMGLRMALGAGRGQVLGLVLSQGARVTVAGLVTGLLVAWWASRAMDTVLFGVGAHDVLTFAAAAAALAFVAILACAIPAVRATRIDPMRALRAD